MPLGAVFFHFKLCDLIYIFSFRMHRWFICLSYSLDVQCLVHVEVRNLSPAVLLLPFCSKQISWLFATICNLMVYVSHVSVVCPGKTCSLYCSLIYNTSKRRRGGTPRQSLIITLQWFIEVMMANWLILLVPWGTWLFACRAVVCCMEFCFCLSGGSELILAGWEVFW
jgi:hypothetical protein